MVMVWGFEYLENVDQSDCFHLTEFDVLVNVASLFQLLIISYESNNESYSYNSNKNNESCCYY